jgi:hypothetical protein
MTEMKFKLKELEEIYNRTSAQIYERMVFDFFNGVEPGEGFAYFCWHSRRWPEPDTLCEGYRPDDEFTLCSRLWDDLQKEKADETRPA